MEREPPYSFSTGGPQQRFPSAAGAAFFQTIRFDRFPGPNLPIGRSKPAGGIFAGSIRPRREGKLPEFTLRSSRRPRTAPLARQHRTRAARFPQQLRGRWRRPFIPPRNRRGRSHPPADLPPPPASFAAPLRRSPGLCTGDSAATRSPFRRASLAGTRNPRGEPGCLTRNGDRAQGGSPAYPRESGKESRKQIRGKRRKTA